MLIMIHVLQIINQFKGALKESSQLNSDAREELMFLRGRVATLEGEKSAQFLRTCATFFVRVPTRPCVCVGRDGHG